MGLKSLAKKFKTGVLSTPKAAKVFGEELVSNVREEANRPGSAGQRFADAPLGLTYPLPKPVRSAAGLLAPSPRKVSRDIQKVSRNPSPGNIAAAGGDVLSLATLPLIVSPALKATRAVAAAGKGRVAAGGARVAVGELGAVGGKRTAAGVAKTAVQKQMAAQARAAAIKDIAAEAAAAAPTAAAKTVGKTGMRIFRNEQGAIQIEHVVGGKSQGVFEAADIMSGKAKVPVAVTRAEAGAFRESFSAVNRGLKESFVAVSQKAPSAVAAAEKAAPKPAVAEVAAKAKVGFRRGTAAEAAPSAKAPKPAARKAGPVKTRKATPAELASTPQEKITAEVAAGERTITGAKKPAFRRGPSAAPTAQKSTAVKVPDVEAVKATAKSKIRKAYTGKKTEAQLKGAYDEAIKVAEGGTPKAAAVAERAVKEAMPKAAKKAPVFGRATKEVSAKSEGVIEDVAPKGRGLAGKAANVALRATMLRPFPKKTAVLATGTVAFANRDKIGAIKGAPDRIHFPSPGPSEPENVRGLKAVAKVYRERGQEGIAALRLGLEDAQATGLLKKELSPLSPFESAMAKQVLREKVKAQYARTSKHLPLR